MKYALREDTDESHHQKKMTMIQEPSQTDIGVPVNEPAVPASFALKATTGVAILLGVLIFLTLGAFGFMLVKQALAPEDDVSSSAKVVGKSRSSIDPVQIAWPTGTNVDKIDIAGDKAIIRLNTPNKGSVVWIVNLPNGRLIAEYGDIKAGAVSP